MVIKLTFCTLLIIIWVILPLDTLHALPIGCHPYYMMLEYMEILSLSFMFFSGLDKINKQSKPFLTLVKAMSKLRSYIIINLFSYRSESLYHILDLSYPWSQRCWRNLMLWTLAICSWRNLFSHKGKRGPNSGKNTIWTFNKSLRNNYMPIKYYKCKRSWP